MKTIVYWNDSKTTLFAVEELRRLTTLAGDTIAIKSHEKLTKHNHEPSINIILTHDYNAKLPSEDQVRINADGFLLLKDGQNQWIIGNEPRALLYGVYAYTERNYGFKFINLAEESISNKHIRPLSAEFLHEPMFVRRGNVFETINDPIYIRNLIDWGVKNGHNEYFFTFSLWDKVKAYLAPELEKRDVHVTLGGHSLSYLLASIQSTENIESLEQDEKLKFFAENTVLQDKVIAKIVRKCTDEPVITRISLWPEDIGIDEKSATEFIATYIKFTERLKAALRAAHLSVEVEHIVYNAGLSWDMLERAEGTDASDSVDVLYAYWGRDYSASIVSPDQNQQRAYESLKDWHTESGNKGRGLTVFEYYSDHFMLSELFPPLINRIKQDLDDYQKLKITGILNLIVPLHKKGMHKEVDDAYPWKWIHHLNNYVYARVSFGKEFTEVVEGYFDQFGDDKSMFTKMLVQLEELISKHTKWNSVIFPARVVDPEKVEDLKHSPEISAYLAEVNELISLFDLSEVLPLLAIQTEHNFESFTTREMMLIYFYYLKKATELYGQSWEEKV